MSPSDDIAKRIFIVGCSRSGTTILQVTVASHSRIASFPETFFFQRLPGRLGRPGLWLGLAGEARSALKEALDRIRRTDLEHLVPQSWRLRPYVDTYLGVLDHQAREEEADFWVEKTPQHVYRLRLLLRYVPRAHVVHMIRDGRDVVASTCHRARKYEERFAEEQKDPSFAIGRWNRALRQSLQFLGEPGHSFVLYEQFVGNPARTMKRICADLGVAYEKEMIEETDEAAESVIPDNMEWLERAKDPPEKNRSKFQRLFSETERREIEKELQLELYERISDRVAEG